MTVPCQPSFSTLGGTTSEAVGAASPGSPVDLGSFLVVPLATPASAFMASAFAAVSLLESWFSDRAGPTAITELLTRRALALLSLASRCAWPHARVLSKQRSVEKVLRVASPGAGFAPPFAGPLAVPVVASVPWEGGLSWTTLLPPFEGASSRDG